MRCNVGDVVGSTGGRPCDGGGRCDAHGGLVAKVGTPRHPSQSRRQTRGRPRHATQNTVCLREAVAKIPSKYRASREGTRGESGDVFEPAHVI